MEIEHSCPQCGAPVVLKETDRLFSCPFCRVRLLLWSGEVFRYVIPPAPSARRRPELLYVPYRRFRGMVFDLRKPEENERVLDTSLLASPPGIFPNSLGLRPQAMRLRFAAFHGGDRCLAPGSVDENFAYLDPGSAVGKRSSPAKPRRTLKSVGEVRSLIYAPFYRARGCWHDGVLDTPLRESPGAGPLPEFKREGGESWDLHFIPTLCPDCGWDLAGISESCLLFCPQCRSGWEPGRQGLRRIVFFRQAGLGAEAAYFYLPFWHFKLPYEPPDHFRLPVSKLFALQAGQSPPWERESTRSVFLVPAFKISPRLFLRLGRTATLTPFTETDLEPDLPSSYHPVTLPAEEALGFIEVIQASLDQETVILNSSRPRIDPRDYESKLVFVPFRETSYELIQIGGGLGIPKNSLNLGRFI